MPSTAARRCGAHGIGAHGTGHGAAGGASLWSRDLPRGRAYGAARKLGPVFAGGWGGADTGNPRDRLYLPAMNNYWTRAAFVALVYFSEIKRDRNYSYAWRRLRRVSQPPLNQSKHPQLGHPSAAACFDKEIEITHTFSKVSFSFQYSVINRALEIVLARSHVPFPFTRMHSRPQVEGQQRPPRAPSSCSYS